MVVGRVANINTLSVLDTVYASVRGKTVCGTVVAATSGIVELNPTLARLLWSIRFLISDHHHDS
ncbi:MAG TPA: hypothetical protein VFB14_23905 [Bryobacteraceae bacterium]|jgi:hypothetical protein|nr:hypothetical protein [Bryobacteraceae bacterium]